MHLRQSAMERVATDSEARVKSLATHSNVVALQVARMSVSKAWFR